MCVLSASVSAQHVHAVSGEVRREPWHYFNAGVLILWVTTRVRICVCVRTYVYVRMPQMPLLIAPITAWHIFMSVFSLRM